MCFYLWERRSECQQLDWELWGLCDSSAYVPAAGVSNKRRRQLLNRLECIREGSVFALCVYLYIDVFIYFPQTGFHPNHPEKGTACVPLSTMFSVLPMLPATCICMYVLYICVPNGHMCSASLLAGP